MAVTQADASSGEGALKMWKVEPVRRTKEEEGELGEEAAKRAHSVHPERGILPLAIVLALDDLAPTSVL